MARPHLRAAVLLASVVALLVGAASANATVIHVKPDTIVPWVSKATFPASQAIELDVFVGDRELSVRAHTDCTMHYYLSGVSVRISACGSRRGPIRVVVANISSRVRRVTINHRPASVDPEPAPPNA